MVADQQLLDSAWQDSTIECPDPECVVTEVVLEYLLSINPDCLLKIGQRSPAEPEGDDTHQWKECVTCGYQTGWVQIDAVSVGGSGESCQVGVPESVRRAASSYAEKAISQRDQGAPLLQIGRRPE